MQERESERQDGVGNADLQFLPQELRLGLEVGDDVGRLPVLHVHLPLQGLQPDKAKQAVGKVCCGHHFLPPYGLAEAGASQFWGPKTGGGRERERAGG